MIIVGEEAFLAPRRASSCLKKGMFLNVEGPLLSASSAFLRIERGMITEVTPPLLLVS